MWVYYVIPLPFFLLSACPFVLETPPKTYEFLAPRENCPADLYLEL
jgi:hypothetical protein